MKRPKFAILFLVRSFEVGGAERQLVALARGLRERRHRVAVACFYRRGPLAEELSSAGIPIIDLRKKGRWEILRFRNRLRRAIREFRPDVIYSFLGGANIAAAAAKPFGPAARLVWSVRASDMDLSQYDWTHRAGYRLERFFSRFPHLIIANSCAGRDYAVANGFPAGRIEVVPNGIDVERFQPCAELRRRQRAAWVLREDMIAIGVLARLDPMKGHLDLLEAAARIAEGHPKVRFICVGSGPEEHRLKSMVAELELQSSILFAGPTNDPAACLNAFDIYCSPSITEGFPNAVAEAMACGLSCVVTDVGDSARIVGETGLVVPQSDPAALASALTRLLDTHRHAMGDPRRRIVEYFSLDAMVDRTAELLGS